MTNFFSMLKSILGIGLTDPTANIQPLEAFQRLNGVHPPQLLDVRSPEEYRQGRIAGSRVIPLVDLGRRLREVDKNKSLLLYCHSGNRSGMALRLLKGRGYTQAAHIVGGISAWSRAGLPVETK